jgi:hypothetical protein
MAAAPPPGLPCTRLHQDFQQTPTTPTTLTLDKHVQIRESVVKVVDGVSFGVRGVKLLFADIGAAGKLFWRAVRGE